MARTIYDITQYSASSISFGSQHTSEREQYIEVGIYNRLTGGYCSGRLPDGKICLKRSIWFYERYNRFNNKNYYFQQVGRSYFATHHDSLVGLPLHVCSFRSIVICCFIFHNNDDCLSYQLTVMINFMPMRIYKIHDLS